MIERLLTGTARAAERAVAATGISADAAAQTAGLAQTGHRPWPLPEGPWLQGQTWRDLLFAHWALPPQALRDVVPRELPLDTFDGRAWVGVTPFEITGLRVHGTLPPPLLSRFAEVNVRTYVTVDGKPGIHFLSLDAASRFAVLSARALYRLPYFHARIAMTRDAAGMSYRAERAASPVALDVRYRATGAVAPAAPGDLEHFLAERYCLYVVDRSGAIRRADIHHPPWPLQAAEAEIERNTMAAPHGIRLDGDPLLHLSARQDVVIWPLRPA